MHQNLDSRVHHLDCQHRLDARHFGHFDVHDNDVGPGLGYLVQHIDGVGESTRHQKIGTVLQQQFHAAHQGFVVVEEGYTDHSARLFVPILGGLLNGQVPKYFGLEDI